jgi:hypothetical protein
VYTIFPISETRIPPVLSARKDNFLFVYKYLCIIFDFRIEVILIEIGVRGQEELIFDLLQGLGWDQGSEL